MSAKRKRERKGYNAIDYFTEAQQPHRNMVWTRRSMEYNRYQVESYSHAAKTSPLVFGVHFLLIIAYIIVWAALLSAFSETSQDAGWFKTWGSNLIGSLFFIVSFGSYIFLCLRFLRRRAAGKPTLRRFQFAVAVMMGTFALCVLLLKDIAVNIRADKLFSFVNLMEIGFSLLSICCFSYCFAICIQYFYRRKQKRE